MNRIRQFREFVSDVRAELKKTTWPSRKEVEGTTMVVIFTVVLCSSFLYVVDLVLGWLIGERLLGAG